VVGKKLQHAVGRRRVGDWIGRVHDGFSSEVARACGAKDIRRCRAFDASTTNSPNFAASGTLAMPTVGFFFAQFGRRARSKFDLVTVPKKALGQRLCHVARTKYSDFHK
jgi:hypothetical protein